MRILKMFRGDTAGFTIPVMRDGVPEDLTDALLTFTAKLSITDTDNAASTIQKTIGSGITVTDAPGGIAEVTIDPADTNSLTQTTTYVYDVQLVTSAGAVETIDKGKLVVETDVTRTS